MECAVFNYFVFWHMLEVFKTFCILFSAVYCPTVFTIALSVSTSE